MDPFFIAYLIGYVWFWRYTVGTTMRWSMESYQNNIPDAFDIFFTGMFIGSFANLAYPVTVPARLLYRQVAAHAGSPAITTIFPAPKPVETKVQKDARKAREAEAHIKRRRAEINAHERENGLELTRWKG